MDRDQVDTIMDNVMKTVLKRATDKMEKCRTRAIHLLLRSGTTFVTKTDSFFLKPENVRSHFSFCYYIRVGTRIIILNHCRFSRIHFHSLSSNDEVSLCRLCEKCSVSSVLECLPLLVPVLRYRLAESSKSARESSDDLRAELLRLIQLLIRTASPATLHSNWTFPYHNLWCCFYDDVNSQKSNQRQCLLSLIPAIELSISSHYNCHISKVNGWHSWWHFRSLPPADLHRFDDGIQLLIIPTIAGRCETSLSPYFSEFLNILSCSLGLGPEGSRERDAACLSVACRCLSLLCPVSPPRAQPHANALVLALLPLFLHKKAAVRLAVVQVGILTLQNTDILIYWLIILRINCK